MVWILWCSAAIVLGFIFMLKYKGDQYTGTHSIGIIVLGVGIVVLIIYGAVNAFAQMVLGR